nr:MAG TPA_asm: hypothetical protein [Caudoviricetes sp.]
MKPVKLAHVGSSFSRKHLNIAICDMLKLVKPKYIYKCIKK